MQNNKNDNYNNNNSNTKSNNNDNNSEQQHLDYIITTFTELTLQHRNEEAIVFIGDILKQIPLKIYLLPNIITLLLQKDSELYNNELKPFFFYTGVFLSKNSSLKETTHQLLYYLFSNDLYERNFNELLQRYEKFIVGKNEQSYPLLMVFGSILHFISWDNQYKQYKEKGSRNKVWEDKLEKYASIIEFKLNTSLSFFPNLEFIIKPLLKVMCFLGKIEDCFVLLLAFIDQYPLNPFGYTLLGSYLIEHKPNESEKIIHCYKSLLNLDPVSNSAFSVLVQMYYSTENQNKHKRDKSRISFSEIFNLYLNRISYTSPASADVEIWKLFYYFLKDHASNSQKYHLVKKVLSSVECISFLHSNFNYYQDLRCSVAIFKYKAAVNYLLTGNLTYINRCLVYRNNFQFSCWIMEFLESELLNLKLFNSSNNINK